jgi:hypothetical protein
VLSIHDLVIIAATISGGMILANFTWANFTEEKYERAVERSFFQVAAVATFLLVAWSAVSIQLFPD